MPPRTQESPRRVRGTAARGIRFDAQERIDGNFGLVDAPCHREMRWQNASAWYESGHGPGV
jgi:hypothetical protein